MKVKCIKEYHNESIKIGETYRIIDADMNEYLIETANKNIRISKNDIEHFQYYV